MQTAQMLYIDDIADPTDSHEPIPDGLEQLPILVGDISLAIKPVRAKLYQEKRFHERSQGRFWWPSQLLASEMDEDVIDRLACLARPLWIEVGLGPASPLPIATPFVIRKIAVLDPRPWVSRLFAFSHNPNAYACHMNLTDELGPKPSMRHISHLRNIAGNIENYIQAGVALYLLTVCNGNAMTFRHFDASLTWIPGELSGSVAPWSEYWPVYPVQVVESPLGTMRSALRIFRSVANLF